MPEINRKLQKLASALYFITEFFDIQEPLRWRLRSLSIDLVSDAIKDKLCIIREVSILFTLAKNTGLISSINYEILTKELLKIERDQEKPLDTIFSRDTAIGERSLPFLSKSEESEHVKDNIVRKPEEGLVLRGPGGSSRPSVKKNSRQNVIINLLKRKKEIMIKDVSPLISSFSEKTIQRELLSMVRAGILRKIGEKRWSRYSLV